MYKETTNAPITQSANHQPHTHECDKLTIIDAVARNSYVYHADGSVCKDGTRHNNDALVMTLCKAPSPSKWIEGEQVYYTEIFYCRFSSDPLLSYGIPGRNPYSEQIRKLSVA